MRPDETPHLAPAAMPGFLVERYHRSFDEEILRLGALAGECDKIEGIDDTRCVRRALARLTEALGVHMREQERPGGVFEAIARGTAPPPSSVDVALFDLVFDLRTEALALAEAQCACRKALRFGLHHFADEIEEHLAVEQVLLAQTRGLLVEDDERAPRVRR